MIEIKFCGLTRPADAVAAGECGATYAGVVFAGGPRAQAEPQARAIFEALPPGVRRVGVFGSEHASAIASHAAALGLDVVQLSGDPTPTRVAEIRRSWPGPLWAALRVRGAELPGHSAELFATADGVLLEARVDGALGGTGVALAWNEVAAAVQGVRRGAPARLILAGGLTAANVAGAIRALRPEVVDVSSGIESTVGVKDPARMRAFRDAVRSIGDFL